jgi:hypothetical protein
VLLSVPLATTATAAAAGEEVAAAALPSAAVATPDSTSQGGWSVLTMVLRASPRFKTFFKKDKSQ